MSLCDQTILTRKSVRSPKLASHLAVDAAERFRDTRFRKKCARGARLLAIFRSRSRAFFRAPLGSVLTVPLSTRSRSGPQCRGGLYVAALQAPPPITVHPRFQVQPACAFGSPMGFSKPPCGTLGRLEGLAG